MCTNFSCFIFAQEKKGHFCLAVHTVLIPKSNRASSSKEINHVYQPPVKLSIHFFLVTSPLSHYTYIIGQANTPGTTVLFLCIYVIKINGLFQTSK